MLFCYRTRGEAIVTIAADGDWERRPKEDDSKKLWVNVGSLKHTPLAFQDGVIVIFR
jgi:hypothetical protein